MAGTVGVVWDHMVDLVVATAEVAAKALDWALPVDTLVAEVAAEAIAAAAVSSSTVVFVVYPLLYLGSHPGDCIGSSIEDG